MQRVTFSQLFRAKQPIVAVRAVHLDLKGTPPTANRLVQLLSVFAAARYNAVLVEWEDSFPWTVDKRFRGPAAYTVEDVRRFHNAAAELGLEIIPLVQCLGHMETPLGIPAYEHLREIPHDSFVLNPLADGARDLVQKMVDDVMALTPGLRHFHLGGDEAWSMGTHPDTRAYIEEHGKGALYLHHVEPIMDNLNARGVRPLLWHDMMIDWDSEALRGLAAKTDLVTWGYTGHPDTTEHHYNVRHIERFNDHGITLWGGAAYKGSDGHNVDRPDIKQRQLNALAWAEVAERYGYKGIIATAWSRCSTNVLQCEPIDAALDSLVNLGVILHDGKLPNGGIETCVAALDELGERKRFEACKAAMDHLTDIRRRGWLAVQSLREQITLATNCPRRRGSLLEWGHLKNLKGIVQECAAVVEEVRRALAGLMIQISIEEYLSSRLDPLQEELATLEPMVRELDPPGWQAQLPENSGS
ncbi:MAG: family 20 glycosylhydrolase [Lentisphaerae bacterium]|nr:family 20 glycosylhydrolase [Lentisphaerota bacterium]